MLVLWGDVADAGVEPDSVVAVADGGQLAVEVARVVELAEVRPFVLEMPEEALDGRLVGRDAGAAVVRGDRVQGHELPS